MKRRVAHPGICRHSGFVRILALVLLVTSFLTTSFLIQKTLALTKPTLVSPGNNATITKASVRFSWSHPYNDQYELKIKTNSGALKYRSGKISAKYCTVDLSSLSLTYGDTYKWYVVVYANGQEDSSEDRYFTYKYASEGYCSVSKGVSVTPSTVTLGQNFSVSFTLKEVRGLPKTFESVAIAILRSDNSYVFDFAMYNNVTVGANSTWNQTATNFLYTSYSPGTYKVIIRGKLSGGDWFDFNAIEEGVNPRSFKVVRQNGWIIYDNFKSGTIDLNKWIPYSWSGGLSIENGKLKVAVQGGSGHTTAYLNFRNPAAGIKGIRAKVYTKSSTGDFRAYIWGQLGRTPNNEPVDYEITVMPFKNAICGWVGVYSSAWTWLYNLFNVNFQRPLDTLGKWYTISVDFPTPPKVTFSVQNQGAYDFTPPANSFTLNGSNYQIGASVFDGTGSGIAYFDDIEILN